MTIPILYFEIEERQHPQEYKQIRSENPFGASSGRIWIVRSKIFAIGVLTMWLSTTLHHLMFLLIQFPKAHLYLLGDRGEF